jgi:pseudoazurin
MFWCESTVSRLAALIGKEMPLNKIAGVIAFATAMAVALPSLGADYEVLMLNKDSQGRTMQFEPAFLRVEPGDTVTFIPADKGHNAETILDLIPGDAPTWKGKTNEAIKVSFTVPGLYAYKCMPHFPMGMVGLIQVGDDRSNMQDIMAARVPARAVARLAELLAMTGSAPSSQ